jgi:HEAT repeat protein
VRERRFAAYCAIATPEAPVKLFGRRTPKVDKLQRKGRLARLLEAARYSDRLVDRTGKVIDRGAPVRADAVRALAAYRAPEGEEPPDLLPVFVERLSDESGQVARAAAAALAESGSLQAAWALVDLLAVRGPALDPATRQAVLDGLRTSGSTNLSEHWCMRVLETRADLTGSDQEDLEAVMDADASADPRASVFEVLAPDLIAPDDPARAATAETILTWCLPATMPGLANLLGRHDVTEGAIRLAGRSGDQELLEPLIRLLEHPSPTNRSQAALALGELSDTAAVLPLMGATSDPDVHVRKSAIGALDMLGSAGVTAAVASMAHSASTGAEAASPALGGRTWRRTLARLTERSALGSRARRRISPDPEGDRYAGMLEARAQYEDLVHRPDRAPGDA